LFLHIDKAIHVEIDDGASLRRQYVSYHL